MKSHPPQQTVLIAVIGRKKDLDILLREKWYRIPAAKIPRREFGWIAFYQTSALDDNGKRIQYYARIDKEKSKSLTRIKLLPDERDHPKADSEYFKIRLAEIIKLSRPIRNGTSMRVTFGFTTLPRLLRFRSMTALFGVKPLERIFRRILKGNDIPFTHEYPVRSRKKLRYRLDIAIFCKNGKINIECDNPKYHSGMRHKYDCRRNRFLERRGWAVLRFSDEDILLNPDKCLGVLYQTIRRFGGTLRG